MEKSTTITPVLWPRKDKKGLYPIKIRSSTNRKSVYVNLHFSVKKSDWSEYKKAVKTTHPDFEEINSVISSMVSELESQLLKPKKRHKKPNSFIKFLKDEIELKRQGNKYFSSKRYQSLLVHLIKFLGNGNDLLFSDIDKDFFGRFIFYLENNIQTRNSNKEASKNTIVNYLRAFITIVNHSIKKDVFEGPNPIPSYLIPKKSKIKKVPLTSNQLWFLNNLKPSKKEMTEGMFNALNVFMFSFWSRGLRISDVLQLKYKDFQQEYLSIDMEKTGSKINIPITINNIERVVPYFPDLTPQFCWKEHKYFTNEYEEQHSSIKDTIPFYSEDQVFAHFSHQLKAYFNLEEQLKNFVVDFNSKKSSKGRKELLFNEDVSYDSKEMFVFAKNSQNELGFFYSRYMEFREIYLTHCRKHFIGICKNHKLNDEYIFPFLRGYGHLKGNKMGDKLSAVTALINKNLYKVSERFDLPKFTTHYARHSFSSISMDMGTDIYTLRNWLGHSSVKITEGYINTLDNPNDDMHSLKMYDLLNS